MKSSSTLVKKFRHSYVLTDGRHEEVNGSFAIILNTLNIDISFFFFCKKLPIFRSKTISCSSECSETYLRSQNIVRCRLHIHLSTWNSSDFSNHVLAVTTSSCGDEGPASRFILRVSFHIGISRAYLQQRFIFRKEAPILHSEKVKTGSPTVTIELSYLLPKITRLEKSRGHTWQVNHKNYTAQHIFTLFGNI
jgi:hypothetical protein